MNHSGTWSPYAGSGSILLAAGLLIVMGILIFVAMRLRRPITFKRPGKVLGVALVGIWVLCVLAFLTAAGIYARALIQQVSHLTVPANPITPVTAASGALAFFTIVYLAQNGGFWVASGSAIVGTIAALMIFELPFDLIVMWHTYPPTPAIPYTLLYFVPLILIAISSFAMLTLSPYVKLSRATLFLLAAMFLIFVVWAVSGFAYPSAPLPTALNMISKVLAFATAVSLFLPPEKSAWFARRFVPARHEIAQ